MNTKVSIIVPCYNQAEFLDSALSSVQKQTLSSWECIIVNDGSTDGTESIAKWWVEKDQRFKYLYLENSGVSGARNLGIINSASEFILPLDADDFISSNYLEECLRFFEGTSSTKIVYGKTELFGRKKGELELGIPSLTNILRHNCIPNTGMFRREDWVEVNGYDEEMEFGFEDWEFWINILKRGGTARKNQKCTLFYRIKSISRSTKIGGDAKKNEKMRDYIFRKHIDAFGYSSTYQVYAEKMKLENRLKNFYQEQSFKNLFIMLAKKFKNSLSP